MAQLASFKIPEIRNEPMVSDDDDELRRVGQVAD